MNKYVSLGSIAAMTTCYNVMYPLTGGLFLFILPNVTQLKREQGVAKSTLGETSADMGARRQGTSRAKQAARKKVAAARIGVSQGPPLH